MQSTDTNNNQVNLGANQQNIITQAIGPLNGNGDSLR